MADTPEKKSYSQHASIFAILSGTVSETETKQVMDKILNDQSITQATFYYRFYLNRAMVQAGMADLYYSQLTPWRDMLKIGLTTFAEKPEPSRSIVTPGVQAHCMISWQPSVVLYLMLRDSVLSASPLLLEN